MRWLLPSLLALLVALTGWALRRQEAPSPPPADASEDQVDYFTEGLVLTTFDAAGQPRRRLRSRSLRHYRRLDETLLEQPHFTLFENRRPLWRIQSKWGILEAGQERLRLEGEVRLERLGDAHHPPLHLETRDLLILPHQEYAETQAPVKITSQTNWISAVGMRAWLRPPGKIQFLSRTRAYYDAH